MKSSDNISSQDIRRRRTKELVSFLNDAQERDLETLLPTLSGAVELFLEEVASRLEPVINDHLRKQNPNTYEEKKEVAKWLNAQLGSLSLAIRCPKTGNHAFLIGDPGYKTGRFQICTDRSTGYRRTQSSKDLPPLQLMPFLPRGDKRGSWGERIQEQASKPKRDR